MLTSPRFIHLFPCLFLVLMASGCDSCDGCSSPSEAPQAAIDNKEGAKNPAKISDRIKLMEKQLFAYERLDTDGSLKVPLKRARQALKKVLGASAEEQKTLLAQVARTVKGIRARLKPDKRERVARGDKKTRRPGRRDLALPEGVRLVEPKQVMRLIKDPDKAQLFDVRTLPEYERQHIKGATHLSMRDLTGATISKDKPTVLYGKTSGDKGLIKTAVRLKESGVRRLSIIDGGFSRWVKGRLPVEPRRTRATVDEDAPVVTAAELAGLKGTVILDVRRDGEFEKGHVKGAVAMGWREIRGAKDEIAVSHPIVVYSNDERGGRRAAAILKSQGFADVRVLAGGLTGWAAEGRPLAK